MFALHLAAAMAAAYLLGSVNGAIILTRLLAGRDIRTMGNRLPGTANVGRSLGKGWGAPVFLWDGMKALAPMLAARALLYPADAAVEAFALAAVGLAAVIGHRRPLWHGFRGGGGVASMIFVTVFFAPVETIAALALATVLVMALLPRAAYKFGRWVPIFFAVIAPVLAVIGSAVVNVPVIPGVSIGGHPWYVNACVTAISLFGLSVNLPVLVGEVRKVTGRRAGLPADERDPGPW
jgi:acyl-phosphate glycerol 3-phosphate acyltransferase